MKSNKFKSRSSYNLGALHQTTCFFFLFIYFSFLFLICKIKQPVVNAVITFPEYKNDAYFDMLAKYFQSEMNLFK